MKHRAALKHTKRNEGKPTVNARSLEIWLETASRRGVLAGLSGSGPLEHHGDLISPRSVYRRGGEIFAIVKVQDYDLLLVVSSRRKTRGFKGREKAHSGKRFCFCPLQHENAVCLRELFAHTAPQTHKAKDASFGTGDRLGIATPGHIRGVCGFKVFPVFAQQSARELELTCRKFEEVVDAATWAVFREGYTGPWGADGDHLKTEEWVKKARSAGCTMITADVSEYIREKCVHERLQKLRVCYNEMQEEEKKIIDTLLKRASVRIEGDVHIRFSEEELLRTVCIYREALQHAGRLYRACLEEHGDVDFELSVDETALPTSPLAHIYISLEMQRMKVSLYSLAPRFVGSFQKAVDYEGDLTDFTHSLKLHAAIARQFGHRISVHSGSDKFSIFSSIGMFTEKMFHLKTSGTSWLEALKVVLRADPELFLRVYCRAKERVISAMRYYTVGFDPAELPDALVSIEEGTSSLFKNAGIRQLLHITYGEVLNDPALKENIYSILLGNRETYWSRLEKHIFHHLEALQLSRTVEGKDPGAF